MWNKEETFRTFDSTVYAEDVLVDKEDDGLFDINKEDVPDIDVVERFVIDDDSVKTIDPDGWWSLVEFDIKGNNPYLAVVDGVLFSKDMTTLFRYPPRKAGENYSVPEGVTVIDNNAFENVRYLRNIQLPSTLQFIRSGAFVWSSIRSIEIPDQVEQIGDDAFNMSLLEEISLPSHFADHVKHSYYNQSADCHGRDCMLNGTQTKLNIKIRD